MRYNANSNLARIVCEITHFNFGVRPLEVAQRKGRIYVRGTALKPDEAFDLERACSKADYIYRGPFA